MPALSMLLSMGSDQLHTQSKKPGTRLSSQHPWKCQGLKCSQLCTDKAYASDSGAFRPSQSHQSLCSGACSDCAAFASHALKACLSSGSTRSRHYWPTHPVAAHHDLRT